MVKEALTIYGLWWATTRFIKWLFILGWPGAIIIGCARLLGSDPDKWSDGTQTIVGIISLAISVPVYLTYRRGVNRDEE